MAVVTAAVLFLTPARGLVFPDQVDRMPPVDYSSDVSGFATVTGVAALAPSGLPTTWRANAASLVHGDAVTPVTLHVGWVTPGGRFAGLDESTEPEQQMVSTDLGGRGLVARSTTAIAGTVWVQRVSNRGETAYTRRVGGVTVVVTGNATDAQLRMLCASLH
jgi:hypothetical protein